MSFDKNHEFMEVALVHINSLLNVPTIFKHFNHFL